MSFHSLLAPVQHNDIEIYSLKNISLLGQNLFGLFGKDQSKISMHETNDSLENLSESEKMNHYAQYYGNLAVNSEGDQEDEELSYSGSNNYPSFKGQNGEALTDDGN